jgi:cytochrome b involved in lipid metabolism
MTDKFYTKEEVLTHNKEGDCWIIIDDQVFDVSKFLSIHPAGRNVIL